MVSMVPTSVSNVSVTPGAVSLLTRCTLLRKSSEQTLPSQHYSIPLSTSVKLFPNSRVGCGIQPKPKSLVVSAMESELTVEEVESTATDNGSGEATEASLDAAETSEESSTKPDASPSPAPSKRSRPARKSEMPPVKNEDLVPGASFTGKVKSIQPFGAFVDFGAFTDGLVHVSQLSDGFVKDVGSIVSVGQEVKVKLVEANTDTGRISLTMRESDDTSRSQQLNDASFSSDRSRTPRKNTQERRGEMRKVSKFVKGQDLEGTVKNLIRAGAFISLPEGEEGFLPTSEEADEGFGNIDGGSSLQVGQEVKVRVLRFTRGQVTLTMKKEEDATELDSKLGQGVVHSATNPFVLAFRSDKDISEFLNERGKEEEAILISS